MRTTKDGVSSETSILHVGGSLGDSGISYAVQIANSDNDASDQNLVSMTHSLGSGASLIFEHVDKSGDKDSSVADWSKSRFLDDSSYFVYDLKTGCLVHPVFFCY